MAYAFLLFILISTVTSSSVSDNLEEKFAYDYDLYESVLDPELCQRHLREMSAFEFYDASFRIPQGMLRGNFYSLGAYHQCLAIEQPLEEGSIRGKYCLIQTESLHIPILTGDSWPANVTWDTRNVANDQLKTYKQVQRDLSALNDEYHSRTTATDILNAVPLTLALCIPRSCSVHDVLRPLTDGPFIHFNYTEEFCRLPDDKPFSGADVAALLVFSVIGCLTLISTAYELHHIFIKKETSKPDELWSCFSVYGNTDRLLTLGSSRRGTLDCLDGIRSLSILWVMFGHSFLAHFGLYLSNYLDFYEWSKQLKSVVLFSTELGVDSFFMLSGLLLVYTTARKMKQTQLMKNLHLFYLNRVLRMFPLLAAAVLLQASVLHQVADGVRWNLFALETQKCRDYWWSALLHVQNLVNSNQMCLPHSWYLSVDVQLYILSPLLLFWVLGSRRSACFGLAAALLASLTFVTIFCFIMEFTAEKNSRYFMYFYRNTLARSPAFVIGMLCGYVLHISRDKKIKISSWVLCSGYILAISTSAYCVYHVHPEWSSQAWVNLNTALVRPAWAASLGWLIIVCVQGYAGPVNWFLSLNMWKFVAKISYAMYLFHCLLQFVTSGANTMPVYFSMENAFVYFASDVAYTVIVSVAACVLIDAPCSTLIRRIMTAPWLYIQYKFEKRLVDITGDRRAGDFLGQRISIAIQRGNVASILGTMPQGPLLDLGITANKTSPKPTEEQKTNGTKGQQAKEEK